MVEIVEQRSGAEIKTLMEDIASSLKRIEAAEQELESGYGIKVSHISLLGRKKSKENWQIILRAGIDKTADGVNRPAVESCVGYCDKKMKQISYHGIGIIQYAKYEQTAIYE